MQNIGCSVLRLSNKENTLITVEKLYVLYFHTYEKFFSLMKHSYSLSFVNTYTTQL